MTCTFSTRRAARNKKNIDMDSAFYAARYGRGTADYINCPMNKEEYLAFYHELINAQTAELKEFDNGKVFEGCMPVEVMATRGVDTLLFGPLKPVGITNPKTGKDDFTPWYSFGRTMPLRRCNTILLGSDAPQIRRTEARIFHDSGAAGRGVCALRCHAPQLRFELAMALNKYYN